MSRDMLPIMAQQTGPDRRSAARTAGTADAVPADAAPAWSGARNSELGDEVDELVACWQAERPDLDVEPLQVLSRVSRLAKHLDWARRAGFFAPGGGTGGVCGLSRPG